MIKIVTDSTSDLSAARQKELNVEVIPLTVLFGDRAFKDGVTLSVSEFYEMLESSADLPTTSQLTTEELLSCFKKHADNGDDVIGIFISAHLSGTFLSAAAAKEALGNERVQVIDSKNTTIGLALLVEHAVTLREQGRTAVEIVDELLILRDKIRLFAAVDTLKYLKKGGRLSTATAMIGGVLGICPIISVIDGKVEAVGKARGRSKALQLILSMLQKDPPAPGYSVIFGHSNAVQAMEQAADFFMPHLQSASILKGDIGCIVGTHVGPGAVGIAYFGK